MKQCSKCGNNKDVSAFRIRNGGRYSGRPFPWCIECQDRKQQDIEAAGLSPEKAKQKARAAEYYVEHRAEFAARDEAYRTDHAKERADKDRAWWEKNKHRYTEKRKASALARRLMVLKHYGGDPPRCACCQEHRIEFLSIDHINGGGGKHRSVAGSDTYRVLVFEGLPEGYRVLCMNCNTAIGYRGYCPHELERRAQCLSPSNP